MKIYRYISDTKLDMFAAQVPRGLRDKLAAELSINLQVVGVSLKEKPSEESRYSKLALVSAYIDEHEAVGTVENPKKFFRGSIPMTWGLIGDQDGVVFFGAELGHLRMGLVGSPQHVIGSAGTPVGIPPSADPGLLAKEVEGLPETAGQGLVDRYRFFGQVMSYAIEECSSKRFPEKLEFLAVRLVQSPDAGPMKEGHELPFVLGSPVYVAVAED